MHRNGTTTGRRGGRGSAFSLLELLVVMSIMIVLAGLVLAAVRGMQESALRKKAGSQIEAIGLALEDFRIDNGEYPINEIDPEQDPEAGAMVLYQALSGDGNDRLGFYGEPSASTGKLASSQKAYMEQLDPQADSQGMVNENAAGVFYVNDPWREPYRYVRHDDDPPGERQEKQRNPSTYDLYSPGQASDPAEGDQESNEKKWITNWD